MEKKPSGRPRIPKRPPVTGLRLDRDLVVALKHRALDEKTSLTELLNKAMEAYLRQR